MIAMIGSAANLHQCTLFSHWRVFASISDSSSPRCGLR